MEPVGEGDVLRVVDVEDVFGVAGAEVAAAALALEPLELAKQALLDEPGLAVGEHHLAAGHVEPHARHPVEVVGPVLAVGVGDPPVPQREALEDARHVAVVVEPDGRDGLA